MNETRRCVLPVCLIVVDDLAWPDVSAYGRTVVHTPHIDSIATRGAAFANGYVVASVCAVSRAGLLTGRTPQRFGFEYNIGSDNGCPIHFGFCDCSHPFGAGKFTYVEGGTRVPFLFSWPAGMTLQMGTKETERVY